MAVHDHQQPWTDSWRSVSVTACDGYVARVEASGSASCCKAINAPQRRLSGTACVVRPRAECLGGSKAWASVGTSQDKTCWVQEMRVDGVLGLRTMNGDWGCEGW